jgi:uncharacterized membrane protein
MHPGLFVAVYLVVDVIYIAISHPLYMGVVKKIQKQETSMDNMRMLAAIGAYACMGLGWYVLVAPAVATSVKNGMCPSVAAVQFGLVYGLVIYGVFNFTNYVMFQEYSKGILALDLLWGTTWVTSLTYLYAMFGVKR